MSEPIEIGKTYRLMRDSRIMECTVVRTYSDLGGTAKVRFSDGGELLTCKQSELATVSEYEAILRERQRKAYREQRENDLWPAIECWSRGQRTPEAMLEHSKYKDLTYWKRQIAQAKKHGFVSE